MTAATDALHIKILTPRAEASKVRFSYEASRDMGLQTRKNWYIDYQGLDVSHVSNDIFALVFLSWQLPVFLKSKAQKIDFSAEFSISEDVWIFIHRLMKNKGISLNRVRFAGLADRSPLATDGKSGYGYRNGGTLSVVADGVPHGTVREVLTQFTEPDEISFRSLDMIFAANVDAEERSIPQHGFASKLKISSDFAATLRRSATGAAPRAFSAYVLAAVPGLIGGGFNKFATFLAGNRFWQHTVESGSIGNAGQRTENFQALSDFLSTAVNYPVQFANVGRSISGLGAVRALNRLSPEWAECFECALSSNEIWTHRPNGVLAYVAALVDRDGGITDRARVVLQESPAYVRLKAVSESNAEPGWDGNQRWDQKLGIHDFEQMELNELCSRLTTMRCDDVDVSDVGLLNVLAPFGKRGYPDLWNVKEVAPSEYLNGFEECIQAVLVDVLESSEWRGEYPMRSEAVKFTDVVELPHPWPLSFRDQRATNG